MVHKNIELIGINNHLSMENIRWGAIGPTEAFGRDVERLFVKD